MNKLVLYSLIEKNTLFSDYNIIYIIHIYNFQIENVCLQQNKVIFKLFSGSYRSIGFWVLLLGILGIYIGIHSTIGVYRFMYLISNF